MQRFHIILSALYAKIPFVKLKNIYDIYIVLDNSACHAVEPRRGDRSGQAAAQPVRHPRAGAGRSAGAPKVPGCAEKCACCRTNRGPEGCFKHRSP